MLPSSDPCSTWPPYALQEESYTAADAEVIDLMDEKERDKIRADPLYRLEHGEKAKVKVWDCMCGMEGNQGLVASE